jgi:hypothetical protein
LGGTAFAKGCVGFHSAIALPSRFRTLSRAVLSSAAMRLSRRSRCSWRMDGKTVKQID